MVEEEEEEDTGIQSQESTYLSKIDIEEERFFGVRHLNFVLLQIFTVYLLHCISFHSHFSLSKYVKKIQH